MTKTIAIIQARMGSTRLPGKILMKIGEKTMVEHILTALQKCHNIDTIYLATSTDPKNRQLGKIAQENKVNIHFGPEDNVLERFCQIMDREKKQGNHYDQVVRICADSPFLDAAEIDNLILAHDCEHADLSINYNHLTGLPCGFGVEVISVKALEESRQLAETDEHREHLDEWILQHPKKYKIYEHQVPQAKRSRVNFTVDTADDFTFLSKLVEMGKTTEPVKLLTVLKENPQLLSSRPLKMFVRADGNGEIGMGNVMRAVTVCDALRHILPKIKVTVFTTAEALQLVEQKGFTAEIYRNNDLRKIIIRERPDIILIDLRKYLDDEASEALTTALKVRFIDSEKVRQVRADILINSFPLNNWPHPRYYSGLHYLPLRKEFSQLPPKLASQEVRNIVISLGGGDQLGEESPGALILKLLSVLEEFPQQVTIIIGSSISAEAVGKITEFVKGKQKIQLLQNVNDIHTLFYNAEIGISGGGNTLLEFARAETPTISISLDYDHLYQDHQQDYCRALENAGASVYLGHTMHWDNEKLKRILQELISNRQKREEMSAKGRELVDDHIMEKISVMILQDYIGGE